MRLPLETECTNNYFFPGLKSGKFFFISVCSKAVTKGVRSRTEHCASAAQNLVKKDLMNVEITQCVVNLFFKMSL